jgi:hypothetical protein
MNKLIEIYSNMNTIMTNRIAVYKKKTSQDRPTQKATNQPCFKTLRDVKININCLHQTSSNCKYHIDMNEKQVTKVRTNDYQSPLEYEVYMLMILSQIMLTERFGIFPFYYDHYLLRDIVHMPDRIYNEALVMELVGDQTLYKIVTGIKASSYSMEQIDDVFIRLSVTMLQYLVIAKRLGMTHNDLHASNILFDKITNMFYIIDFGCLTMNIENVKDIIQNPETTLQNIETHTIKKFTCGYRKASFNYVFDYSKPYMNDNPYMKNDEKGHLSDIFTVALSLLPCLHFAWPPWFKVTQVSGRNCVCIDLSKTTIDKFVTQNIPSFMNAMENKSWMIKHYMCWYQSLIWGAICIVSVSDKDLNKPITYEMDYLYKNNYLHYGGNQLILFDHKSFKRALAEERYMSIWDSRVYGAFISWIEAYKVLQSAGSGNEEKRYTDERAIIFPPPEDNVKDPRESWIKDQTIQSVRINSFSEPSIDTTLVANKAIENGGTIKRHKGKKCRVFCETNTKREYIRHGKQKWYLDEHRNQYIFLSKDRRHLCIR